jgi:hypothetical protein
LAPLSTFSWTSRRQLFIGHLLLDDAFFAVGFFSNLTPPGLAGCQMCAHDVGVQRQAEPRFAGHLNESILDAI